MNTPKRYEVLESLPAYGPMYIPVTDDDSIFHSEGFVVRFYKSDGSEWVANFKPGWTKFNSVHEFPDLNFLLVIAGGKGYFMDPNETKPLSSLGLGVSNVIEVPDGKLVLQDDTHLTIVEPDGKYWSTERISWDDIKDLELNEKIIKGLSYNPGGADSDQWVEFTLNLDTKILTGGSYSRWH